jgi:outer membrane immunogenic protein
MMTSLKALLLAAAAALTASAALAADLPSRRAAPAPYASVPAFTWTGFYAGLNAGAAFDNSSRSLAYGPGFGSLADTTVSGFKRSSDEVSFTGGGQVGYNRQFGSIVAGLEADLNYAGLKGRYTGTGRTDLSAVVPGLVYTETLAARSSVDWFGTVRGRVGFLPTERLMVYGTAGLAYGDVKTRGSYDFSYTVPGGPATTGSYAGSRSDMRVGYAVGAGLEYAVTQNVSIKGEYLYADLGRESTTAQPTSGAVAGNTLTIRDDASFSVARVGLNWKFNTIGF